MVHHANVLVDRIESARVQEASPGAGFGGMEIKIESAAFDPDSHFLFRKPGTKPYTEPDGMALRLDAYPASGRFRVAATSENGSRAAP